MGIFNLVLREGMTMVVIGFALGIVGVSALARYIGSVLFGVQPLDPVVIVSAGAVLTVVALVACSLPATRATRINPVEALTAE
jgi:putative ABC transport system permease protein